AASSSNESMRSWGCNEASHAGWIHAEAARWLASLRDVQHGCIGRLEMAAEAVGIEQRMREPVGVELAANRLKQGRIAGEFQRQRLVVIERRGHQLRKTDGVQKARGDPPRKRRT